MNARASVRERASERESVVCSSLSHRCCRLRGLAVVDLQLCALQPCFLPVAPLMQTSWLLTGMLGHVSLGEVSCEGGLTLNVRSQSQRDRFIALLIEYSLTIFGVFCLSCFICLC